jgi:lipopolysaccharide transport system ATP-binding protein
MQPAIRADHVSKQYHLGIHRRNLSLDLRETIDIGVRRLFRRIRPTGVRAADQETPGRFWAVKDASFEVSHGEIVGIIGRNGAGKSTLLKMLSRITEPTAGRIDYWGRMASLLEVGTGFHPDLTGRENIYLNGSLLGMSRREIERKFDEIVSFSEIERFLDTPVKRYSSGMYVRLAFAVAAHLEPEILIIDEVLAVGDVAFQKKCLGKISDVVHDGRSVLFVSHNMTAVGSLCERIIVMEQGRITFDGPSADALTRYARLATASPSVDLSSVTERRGRQEYGRLTSVSLFDAGGRPCDHFAMGETMIVEIEVECSRRIYPGEVVFALVNSYGMSIHYFVSAWEGLELDLVPGCHRFRVTIPQVLVFPGTYGLGLALKRQGDPMDDGVDGAIRFTVDGADVTGHNPYFERYAFCKTEVYCPSHWTYAPTSNENQRQNSRGAHD